MKNLLSPEQSIMKRLEEVVDLFSQENEFFLIEPSDNLFFSLGLLFSYEVPVKIQFYRNLKERGEVLEIYYRKESNTLVFLCENKMIAECIVD